MNSGAPSLLQGAGLEGLGVPKEEKGERLCTWDGAQGLEFRIL